MPEVSSIEDAYKWPIVRLAEAFGFHRDTVRKRIRQANVVPAGMKSGNPVYALKDVGPALFNEYSQSGGDVDPKELPPMERRAWYQSENERVKLEKDLRSLVSVDESTKEMANLAMMVAKTLDGLADILERDVGLDPESLERVQQVTDSLREQTYQKIIADTENE
jgi:hypothetical protein